MLDFIKSLELSKEIKIEEIYYLFKTESSDINQQILSSLKKFKTTQEFINYYINQDTKVALDHLKYLSTIISKICGEQEKNIFKTDYEEYISALSKIIFLFIIIKKNNDLLNNLLINTKKYIKNFYIEFQIKNLVKENINSCINNLAYSNLQTFKRNDSRRSTSENTIISLSKFKSKGFLEKQSDLLSISNEDDFLNNTPKFKEDENKFRKGKEELKNNKNISYSKSNKNIENIKEGINKNDSLMICDSSLTLSKMKFVFEPEHKQISFTEKEKYENIFKRKNNHNKKKSKSIDQVLIDKYLSKTKKNNIFKRDGKNKHFIKLILDDINSLYKNGKINSEIKIDLKQFVISNSNNIKEKFIEFYNVDNNDYEKIVNSENIQKFLFDKLN